MIGDLFSCRALKRLGTDDGGEKTRSVLDLSLRTFTSSSFSSSLLQLLYHKDFCDFLQKRRLQELALSLSLLKSLPMPWHCSLVSLQFYTSKIFSSPNTYFFESSLFFMICTGCRFTSIYQQCWLTARSVLSEPLKSSTGGKMSTQGNALIPAMVLWNVQKLTV